MTIDVYDDPCLAAASLGLLNPIDLDGGCNIYLKEFAKMAATWQVDYALTAPVDDWIRSRTERGK